MEIFLLDFWRLEGKGLSLYVMEFIDDGYSFDSRIYPLGGSHSSSRCDDENKYTCFQRPVLQSVSAFSLQRAIKKIKTGVSKISLAWHLRINMLYLRCVVSHR